MECSQLELGGEMTRSLLQNSGIQDKALTKVLQQLDNTEYFSGKVQSVLTVDNNKKSITVGEGITSWTFNFPPNTGDYEAELIRAQNSGLSVLGAYRPVNGSKTLWALIIRK